MLGCLTSARNWRSATAALARLGSELDLLAKQAGTAAKRCRDAEQATNGLLDQRDELRGRLEAYRAKAARLGAAEHLDLDQGYQQAVLSLDQTQGRS